MNISYIRMGEGKDLVFLHGYLASKESFYPQISYFSRFFRGCNINKPLCGKNGFQINECEIRMNQKNAVGA